MYHAETIDVAVIGGGHAGCEAALAAARLGMPNGAVCHFSGQYRYDALQSLHRGQLQGASGA